MDVDATVAAAVANIDVHDGNVTATVDVGVELLVARAF
jgi:hypothetical protein